MQQIYGDEFTVESLEEGIFNNLVRNEIVSQKALLYQVKQMNLVNSEDEAKRLIMSEPSFQTDGLFDQNIFEATIRQNGILPNFRGGNWSNWHKITIFFFNYNSPATCNY